MPGQTVQTQTRLPLKKQSDQIRAFPVCYSDKHFVNSIPDTHDNQHFIWEQEEKSVPNFRKFTMLIFYCIAKLILVFAGHFGDFFMHWLT